MELYYLYLQLPGTIRIGIDVFLLILMAFWFYLPFAVIGTSRRLLKSIKQVEDNTHWILKELRKMSWNLEKFEPTDEGISEEAEFEDEDRTPTCITCEKCYHMNDVGAQICTRCTSWL